MIAPVRAAIELLCPNCMLYRAVQRVAIIAFLAAIALTIPILPAEADTLIVNSTDDDDDLGHCRQTNQSLLPLGFVPDPHCTLREAVRNANISGTDTIIFSLGSCNPWCTIVLATPLLPLTDNGTTIDGFAGNANWGYKGSNLKPGVDSQGICANLRFRKPTIAIDGPDAGDGFVIDGIASYITIRGLAIYGTGTGEEDNAVEAEGGPGTNRVVEAMFIGVLPDGSDPVANRNQGFGVRQRDGGRLDVTWSYVGYNGLGGIDGEASLSVIEVLQNEVFQNGWNSESHDGIDINGINGLAKCNYSRDNTNNTSGKQPQGDSGNGLEIGSQERVFDLDNNRAEYNTLYKNLSAGLSIRKGPRGNFFKKNVIWHNHVGISVNTEGRAPTNRNLLSDNSIFRNTRLGIDLQHVVIPDESWEGNPDGVTANDTCDPDAGGPDGSVLNTASNDLQNFPKLNTAKRHKKKTTISGTLNSTASKWFDIEFFATPAADMSGPADREGKIFLGHKLVQTSASCYVSFTADILAGVPDTYRITATARIYEDDPLTTPGGAGDDPWSTSEFSAPIKPPQQDSDDFDSDDKRDDQDSDDDNDGRKDDEDSDDDNDGRKDDEDSDDDDDGVKDRDDSKSHREKQDSDTRRLRGRQQASLSSSNDVLFGSMFGSLGLLALLRRRRTRLPSAPRSSRKVVITIVVASAMILAAGIARSQQGDEEDTYPIVVDSNALLLIAVAQEAAQDPLIPDDPDDLLGGLLDPLEQPLVVEIYDPLGNLIATSPPTPGPAIATAVPLGAGTYTVKVRNESAREVTYDIQHIVREEWSVATASATAPELGASESFAVLGGAAVTVAGAAPTVITGDAGSSPTPSMTGFPPGVVVPPFTLYTTNDPVVQEAQVAKTAAYNVLASPVSNPCGPVVIPADQLGGQVLGPGVYCMGAADLTGVLTLATPGIYVFKAASSLITAAASNIVLGPGVSSCDVYWQVTSSATLGAASTFRGNIFALAAITVGTTATVTGRTWAGSAVTFAGGAAVGGCSSP